MEFLALSFDGTIFLAIATGYAIEIEQQAPPGTKSFDLSVPDL